MKRSAKVLVITRTKNRPELLARALASVDAQGVGGWLHAIVNDGGDPGAVDALIARFPGRAGRERLAIHNAASVGMEAASIMAVEAVDSEFIALLDDDDTWSPRYLERMVGRLEAAGAAGAAGVACQTTLVHERMEGGAAVEMSREPFNADVASITLFAACRRPQFTTNAFVFRRGAYHAAGGFNAALPVQGDWDFNMRFLSKADIDWIPEPLAFYHIRKAAKDMPNSNHAEQGAKPHDLWKGKILNRMLREDLAQGRLGLGALANIAQDFERLDVSSKNPVFTAIEEFKAKAPRRWMGLLRKLGL